MEAEIIFVKEVIRNPLPPMPCIVPVPVVPEFPVVPQPPEFLIGEPILAANFAFEDLNGLLPLPPPPQPPPMPPMPAPLPYFPVQITENFFIEVDYIVGRNPLYVSIYNCKYQHAIPAVSCRMKHMGPNGTLF
jgi:hypothetical protein